MRKGRYKEVEDKYVGMDGWMDGWTDGWTDGEILVLQLKFTLKERDLGKTK